MNGNTFLHHLQCISVIYLHVDTCDRCDGRQMWIKESPSRDGVDRWLNMSKIQKPILNAKFRILVAHIHQAKTLRVDG